MKEEPAFRATGISEDEDSAFYGGKPKKFKTSFNKATFGSKPEKRENNGTNPRDSNGNFLTCRNCGSRFHFLRHCPENQIEKDTRTDAYLTFACLGPAIVNETFGKGIVDSGCTRTVCGNNWINNFVSKLSSLQREKIKKSNSQSSILFGGGTVSYSWANCKIPSSLGSLSCYLEVEVIKGNLPLLVSLNTLRKMDAGLHFGRETLVIASGQVLQLKKLVVDISLSTYNRVSIASKILH